MLALHNFSRLKNLSKIANWKLDPCYKLIKFLYIQYFTLLYTSLYCRKFHLLLKPSVPLSSDFKASTLHQDGSTSEFSINRDIYFEGSSKTDPGSTVHVQWENDLAIISINTKEENYFIEVGYMAGILLIWDKTINESMEVGTQRSVKEQYTSAIWKRSTWINMQINILQVMGISLHDCE